MAAGIPEGAAVAATVAAAGPAIAASVPPSDPILSGLAWVAAIVAAIIAIGLPIRNYVRGEHRATAEDKVGDARASAESTLYLHLAEQVSQYRTIADKAYQERNALVDRVARLEEVTKVIDEAKVTMERMKAKLEYKDMKLEEKDQELKKLISQSNDERKQFLAILQAKDAEIARRDERIMSLEERLRELEVRLGKDEQRMTSPACPFLSKDSITIAAVPDGPDLP